MWALERIDYKEEKEKKDGMRSTSLNKALRALLLALRYIFVIVILVFLVSHESSNPKFGKPSVEFFNEDFRKGIQHSIADLRNGQNSDTLEGQLISQFYSSRKNLPAWTKNFETNHNYAELISLISAGFNYGLLPSNYNLQELREFEKLLEEDSKDKLKVRVEFERTITEAAIRFMKHLSAGMGENDTTPAGKDFLSSIPLYLNRQIEEGTLKSGILVLQPKDPQYVRLQKALARYLHRAMNDTIEYEAEELVRDNSLVAARLIRQGYLDEHFVNDSLAITAALRNFQKAHLLEVNGKVDQPTTNMLTQDTRSRFYRIALNLDRIRKSEVKNGSCILVNIPEFRLHYYNQSGEEKVFNVIVGAQKTPTPVLSSKIERIETNPNWTVPQSITRNEILPRLKKDTTYLDRNNFIVVDRDNNVIDADSIDWDQMKANEFVHYFRQTNVNNSLGVVKFLFPNEHSVYLHDTNAKSLFNNKLRAYSHGCIRVQNPVELAQMIMEDSGQHQAVDLNKEVGRKSQKVFRLNSPLPIYIEYYTCTADSAGNIYYHPDIYSRDEEAMEDLFKGGSLN